MAGPVFILATELDPGKAAWGKAAEQASQLEDFVERFLGLEARVRVASLPSLPTESSHELAGVIAREIAEGASELFVLPVSFEPDIWQRASLGQILAEARRLHPSVSIHHDDVDPSQALLVACFSDLVLREMEEQRIAPPQAGVLLVAGGQGDPAGRADCYRLMRLLWEQTGVRFGEVGFARHAQPFLPEALKRCQRESVTWFLLPQCQWETELCDHARLILADHLRAHACSNNWRFLNPPGAHPATLAWLEQRLRRLWQEKRARQAAHVPSRIHQDSLPSSEVWTGERWAPPDATDRQASAGLLGRARGEGSLAEILLRILPQADRYLVKVTWHGYATGTYTGPEALDRLLGALPGKAVLLEGHTSSRNLGGAKWDWESEARQHRVWIRQQEREFLRRTGLAEVISRRGAQYLNVTEAWWDGDCASEEQVHLALGGTTLLHSEVAGFVPSVLMDLRGLPLLSFARFKGPTRLGIANLFGLIPAPLRSAWHGPNITHFASVCCDVARMYASLFPLFGLVEAFESAVRWDGKGLYRSRWGNYDLVSVDGIFTISEGLVGADLLASRLQGQDVRRSGFYDVVRERLGWSQIAAEIPLPVDVQATLA